MKRNRVKEYLPLMALVVMALVMVIPQGCANTTQAPSGGDKDSIPPVLVRTSPAYGSLEVPLEGVTFVFTFDEYVKIKDAKSILLSPPQMKQPKTKISGKSVQISFEEAFLPNTTYSICLNGAIADNNEGNVFPDYSFAFSTGSTLDTMSFTGKVLSYDKLMPVEGALVLLYKEDSDSAVFQRAADAVYRTGKDGAFLANNLDSTKYRAYAVMDEIRNFKYDPDKEMIAFIDSLIMPMEDYTFYMYKESEHRQMLKLSGMISEREGYLKFSAPDAHIDTLWINGFEEKHIISQFNKNMDSLSFWINRPEMTSMPDTLELNVQYIMTDSLGGPATKLEQIFLSLASPEEDSSNKQKKVEGLEMDFAAEPEMVDKEGIAIVFSSPIVYEQFDSVKVEKIDSKKVSEPLEFSVSRDSTDIKHFILRLNENLQEGFEYKISVPDSCFADIRGFLSKSKPFSVSLPSDRTLSTLMIEVSGTSDSDYIISLYDEKKSKIISSRTVSEDTTVSFPYLKAGNYHIRIFEDKNGNSEVDPGILMKRILPEKVVFYEMGEDKYITIPESSEILQSINLRELLK